MIKKRSKSITPKVDKTKVTDENKMMFYSFVVLVLAMILFWALKKGTMNNNVSQINQKIEENTYPAINSSVDLDRAIKDLDANNIDVIDRELKGLDTDSSNF